ncbi:MAG: HypC/HybG/HupF family hydrogenase formation chaperone [bacterium]|nr:HypC/HybG/HupF family hydrogenase formation chaperone [bacterium]
MCLAIPQKITKIKNQKAITADNDVLDYSLVPVKIGDWVLEQNDLIIAKITSRQARDMIHLYFSNF